MIKCKGCDESRFKICRGNNAADQAAKKCAGYQVKLIMMSSESECSPELRLEEVVKLQKGVSPEEKTIWKTRGGRQDGEGLWRAPDGRLILPSGIRKCMRRST